MSLRYIAFFGLYIIFSWALISSVIITEQIGPGKYFGKLATPPSISEWMPNEWTASGWLVEVAFGTLYFCNGCYVSSVSKHIKNDLVEYDGKPLNVHVYKSCQPINPGNTRIDSVVVIGNAEPDSIYNSGISLNLNIETGKANKNLIFKFELKINNNHSIDIYPAQMTFIITKKQRRMINRFLSSEMTNPISFTTGNLIIATSQRI